MKSSLSKKALVVALSALLPAQTVLASLAESDMWKERRNALEKNSPQQSNQLASLPTNFQTPQSIMNQLPAVGAALPQTAKGSESNKRDTAKFSQPIRSVLDSIPLTFGSIQDVYDSKNENIAPLVLLQDVHLNPEAQTNLAAILQNLISQKQAGLVGIEGAFDLFDFSVFRAFPDKKITKEVSDEFLKKNYLAAPSYVGITSAPELPPFMGVDDFEHYKTNVKAFLATIDLKEKTKKDISAAMANLATEKERIFSAELKSFDDLRVGYHRGQIGLGSYVKKISALNTDTDFIIDQFLEAYNMESSLDFQRVDRERRTVIEKLTQKLKEKELSDLLTQSLAYRMGRISFGVYYRDLKNLCESKGVSLKQTPAFDNYIRYVLLSDGIKVDKLFTSLNKLEIEILASLAKTKEEKELAAASEHLLLTEKLIDFSLTPNEWKKYKVGVIASNRRERGNLKAEPKLEIASSHKSLLAMTKPFEQFYEQADFRSHKMVANLQKAVRGAQSVVRSEDMKLRTTDYALSTILVTGGFHTPQIAQLLKDQKISYIIASPKISKIESGSGSEYLSIFAREKSSLDQLFKGEKLFLAPVQIMGVGGTGITGELAKVRSEQWVQSREHPEKSIPPTLPAKKSNWARYPLALFAAMMVFVHTGLSQQKTPPISPSIALQESATLSLAKFDDPRRAQIITVVRDVVARLEKENNPHASAARTFLSVIENQGQMGFENEQTGGSTAIASSMHQLVVSQNGIGILEGASLAPNKFLALAALQSDDFYWKIVAGILIKEGAALEYFRKGENHQLLGDTITLNPRSSKNVLKADTELDREFLRSFAARTVENEKIGFRPMLEFFNSQGLTAETIRLHGENHPNKSIELFLADLHNLVQRVQSLKGNDRELSLGIYILEHVENDFQIKTLLESAALSDGQVTPQEIKTPTGTVKARLFMSDPKYLSAAYLDELRASHQKVLASAKPPRKNIWFLGISGALGLTALLTWLGNRAKAKTNKNNPASIFYRHYLAKQEGRAYNPILAWMGNPITGSPVWEVVFNLTIPLTLHLLPGMTLIAGLAWLISNVIFAKSHADRSPPEQKVLFAVGLAFGLPFFFSGLDVLSQSLLSIFLHSLYNFGKLQGWLPKWMPEASIRMTGIPPSDRKPGNPKVEVIEKTSPNWTYIGQAHIGGEKNKHFLVDSNNQLWIFKENPYANQPYRALGAYIYNQFVRTFFSTPVQVRLAQFDGKLGTLEKVLLKPNSKPPRPWADMSIQQVNEEFSKWALPNFNQWNKLTHGSSSIPVAKNIFNLTDAQIQNVLQEMVIAWLFSNHDTHPGNYLVDESGQLIGIDHEQVFKYFQDSKYDLLSLQSLPNGQNFAPLHYLVLMKLALAGKLDVKLLENVLKRIEEIPDDNMRTLIRPFAEQYAQANPGKFQSPEDFIEALITRKQNLRASFSVFFNTLNKQFNGKIMLNNLLKDSKGAGNNLQFSKNQIKGILDQQKINPLAIPPQAKDFLAAFHDAKKINFIQFKIDDGLPQVGSNKKPAENPVFNKQVEMNQYLAELYGLPSELIEQIKLAGDDPDALAQILENYYKSLKVRAGPRLHERLLDAFNTVKKRLLSPSQSQENLKIRLRLLTSWIASLKKQRSNFHRVYLARDAGIFHLVDQTLEREQGKISEYDPGSSVYHLSTPRMSGENSHYVYRVMKDIIERGKTATPNENDIGLLYKNIRKEFLSVYNSDPIFRKMVDAVREELLELGYGNQTRLIFVDTGFRGTMPFFLKNALDLGKNGLEILGEDGDENIQVAIVQPTDIGFAKQIFGYKFELLSPEEQEILKPILKTGQREGLLGLELEGLNHHPIRFNSSNWMIESSPEDEQLRFLESKIMAVQMVLAYVAGLAGVKEKDKEIAEFVWNKSLLGELIKTGTNNRIDYKIYGNLFPDIEPLKDSKGIEKAISDTKKLYLNPKLFNFKLDDKFIEEFTKVTLDPFDFNLKLGNPGWKFKFLLWKMKFKNLILKAIDRYKVFGVLLFLTGFLTSSASTTASNLPTALLSSFNSLIALILTFLGSIFMAFKRGKTQARENINLKRMPDSLLRKLLITSPKGPLKDAVRKEIEKRIDEKKNGSSGNAGNQNLPTTPASIFYRHYLAKQEGRNYNPILAWMGNPITGSPVWEVVFNLSIPLTLHLLPGMTLVAGLIWLISNFLFAKSHVDRSPPEQNVLFVVGLGFGLPFFIPGLDVLSQSLLSIFIHALYNSAVLNKWLPAWFPTATIPNQSTRREKQDKILEKLLQDLGFSEEMAHHLNSAYNKDAGTNYALYPEAPEDQAKPSGLTVRDAGIATNLAGFYALEAGLGMLRLLGPRKNQNASQILEDIINDRLTGDERELLMRAANLSWKTSQPFRAKPGKGFGSRIQGNQNFVLWESLDNPTQLKDLVQIKAAAEKTLTAIRKIEATDEEATKTVLQVVSFARGSELDRYELTKQIEGIIELAAKKAEANGRPLTKDDIEDMREVGQLTIAAHHDQFRKDGVTPYIVHPIQVTRMLVDKFNIFDPLAIQIALLHDTREDQSERFKDIKHLLEMRLVRLGRSQRTANLIRLGVRLLSKLDDSEGDEREYFRRMLDPKSVYNKDAQPSFMGSDRYSSYDDDFIRHIQLIKVCDRISNIGDLEGLFSEGSEINETSRQLPGKILEKTFKFFMPALLADPRSKLTASDKKIFTDFLSDKLGEYSTDRSGRMAPLREAAVNARAKLQSWLPKWMPAATIGLRENDERIQLLGKELGELPAYVWKRILKTWKLDKVLNRHNFNKIKSFAQNPNQSDTDAREALRMSVLWFRSDGDIHPISAPAIIFEFKPIFPLMKSWDEVPEVGSQINWPEGTMPKVWGHIDLEKYPPHRILVKLDSALSSDTRKRQLDQIGKQFRNSGINVPVVDFESNRPAEGMLTHAKPLSAIDHVLLLHELPNLNELPSHASLFSALMDGEDLNEASPTTLNFSASMDLHGKIKIDEVRRIYKKLIRDAEIDSKASGNGSQGGTSNSAAPASILLNSHPETLGHPLKGAPWWEPIFQWPMILPALGVSWSITLPLAVFMAGVFGWAHRDRSPPQRIWLGIMGLVFSSVMTAPLFFIHPASSGLSHSVVVASLQILIGYLLNAWTHLGYNAGVMNGWLAWWMPTANILTLEAVAGRAVVKKPGSPIRPPEATINTLREIEKKEGRLVFLYAIESLKAFAAAGGLASKATDILGLKPSKDATRPHVQLIRNLGFPKGISADAIETRRGWALFLVQLYYPSFNPGPTFKAKSRTQILTDLIPIALEKFSGNLPAAAEWMGIDHGYLWRVVNRLKKTSGVSPAEVSYDPNDYVEDQPSYPNLDVVLGLAYRALQQSQATIVKSLVERSGFSSSTLGKLLFRLRKTPLNPVFFRSASPLAAEFPSNLADIEELSMRVALSLSHGNAEQAERLLKRSHTVFYDNMKKYHIRKNDPLDLSHPDRQKMGDDAANQYETHKRAQMKAAVRGFLILIREDPDLLAQISPEAFVAMNKLIHLKSEKVELNFISSRTAGLTYIDRHLDPLVRKLEVYFNLSLLSPLTELDKYARDHYQKLGVDRKTSEEEVQRNFRKLVKKFQGTLARHDNRDHQEEAEFRDLVRAYEILYSEKGRQSYERNLFLLVPPRHVLVGLYALENLYSDHILVDRTHWVRILRDVSPENLSKLFQIPVNMLPNLIARINLLEDSNRMHFQLSGQPLESSTSPMQRWVIIGLTLLGVSQIQAAEMAPAVISGSSGSIYGLMFGLLITVLLGVAAVIKLYGISLRRNTSSVQYDSPSNSNWVKRGGILLIMGLMFSILFFGWHKAPTQTTDMPEAAEKAQVVKRQPAPVQRNNNFATSVVEPARIQAYPLQTVYPTALLTEEMKHMKYLLLRVNSVAPESGSQENPDLDNLQINFRGPQPATIFGSRQKGSNKWNFTLNGGKVASGVVFTPMLRELGLIIENPMKYISFESIDITSWNPESNKYYFHQDPNVTLSEKQTSPSNANYPKTPFSKALNQANAPQALTELNSHPYVQIRVNTHGMENQDDWVLTIHTKEGDHTMTVKDLEGNPNFIYPPGPWAPPYHGAGSSLTDFIFTRGDSTIMAITLKTSNEMWMTSTLFLAIPSESGAPASDASVVVPMPKLNEIIPESQTNEPPVKPKPTNSTSAIVTAVQRGDLVRAVQMAAPVAESLGVGNFGSKSSRETKPLDQKTKESLAIVFGGLIFGTNVTSKQEYTFGFFDQNQPDERRVTVALAKAAAEGRAIRLIVAETQLKNYQHIAAQIKRIHPKVRIAFETFSYEESFYRTMTSARGKTALEVLTNRFGPTLAQSMLIYSGIQFGGTMPNTIAFDDFLPPIELLLKDDRIIKILRAIQTAA